VAGLKISDGKPPVGFAVAGTDGVFHRAEACIEGSAVRLRSAAVADPKAVQYAYGVKPAVNLANDAELPAHPFRTDAETRKPTPKLNQR
jgi:sialate O-acetylesterase